MDRVLIVDDDRELCELLAERLGTEEFVIEAVHDGPRGLERALSHDYSLVVLDLMLPGMGGLDVLRHIRARSPLPVLILTARGEDIDRILVWIGPGWPVLGWGDSDFDEVTELSTRLREARSAGTGSMKLMYRSSPYRGTRFFVEEIADALHVGLHDTLREYIVCGLRRRALHV
jgi:CheY-like chemotaxis protein